MSWSGAGAAAQSFGGIAGVRHGISGISGTVGAVESTSIVSSIVSRLTESN